MLPERVVDAEAHPLGRVVAWDCDAEGHPCGYVVLLDDERPPRRLVHVPLAAASVVPAAKVVDCARVQAGPDRASLGLDDPRVDGDVLLLHARWGDVHLRPAGGNPEARTRP